MPKVLDSYPLAPAAQKERIDSRLRKSHSADIMALHPFRLPGAFLTLRGGASGLAGGR